MKYKKPTFNLYRIIRLEDGRSFQGWNYDNKAYWTPVGAFFRTEEAIKKHLWRLVRKPIWIDSQQLGNVKINGHLKWSDEISGERDKYAIEKYHVLELEKVTIRSSAILDGIKLKEAVS